MNTFAPDFVFLEEGFCARDIVEQKINETSMSDDKDAFYVCDLGDVLKKHMRWARAMPRVTPFYAVKCNDSRAVVTTLASLNAGFDCASKTEIQIVQSLGVDANRIIYANPCKQVSQIKYASAHGVQMMTFDSDVELMKVARYHDDAKLVLRIATDDSKAVCRLSVKFGAMAPLPLPGATPWPLMHTFPSYQYTSNPYSSQPPPYHELSSYSYAPGSTGSQHSEGSRSSGSTRSEGERRRGGKGGGGVGSTSGRDEKSPVDGGRDSRSGSGSESEYSVRSSLRRGEHGGSATPSEHSHYSHVSQRSHHRAPPPHLQFPQGIPLSYNPMMLMMVPQHPHVHPHTLQGVGQTGPLMSGLPPGTTPGGPPGAPPTRDLGSVPPELTASRQSFHLAMGNPSEFFVDVM